MHYTWMQPIPRRIPLSLSLSVVSSRPVSLFLPFLPPQYRKILPQNGFTIRRWFRRICISGIRDVGSGNPLRPRAATSSSPSFTSLLESIPPVLSPPQIRIPGGPPYSYRLLSRIEMCQSIPEMYNNRKGNNPFASSDCECNLC